MASLSLNIAVAAALAAAIALPALTHDAPQGTWVGPARQIAEIEQPEPEAPAWDPAYAAQFPDCTGHQAHQPGDLVVYTLRGDVRRMDFGRAWERNHDAEDANDVWVVGWCT